MILRWHPAARAEANHAANHYREKRRGLELQFLDRLEEALGRIVRRPNIHRQLIHSVRSCRIPHFPYAVIFRATTESVEIIAVMHVRRAPGYWFSRI